jgi:lysophospholipase L1-like esterase
VRSRRRRARRWALGILAVPLLLIAVLVIEVELARRGENLPDEPFVLDGRLGTGAGVPLRVVWLGDSTAAGVGAADADGALPRQVAARLERPVDLAVLAVSGARIDDVVDRQVADVRDLRPDLVVISIGANDVTHLTTSDHFFNAYAQVLDAIPDGVDVVLLGVPDMGAPPRLAQPLRHLAGVRGGTLDARVQELARGRDLGYVDIAGGTGPEMRRHPDLFSADRYHPDSQGYEVWADEVVPVVLRRLESD